MQQPTGIMRHAQRSSAFSGCRASWLMRPQPVSHIPLLRPLQHYALVCSASGQPGVHSAVVNDEPAQKTTAFPFPDLEPKWQKYWADNKTFRTPESVDTTKPKHYVLDMFPYPSGAGLHVGHPEGYTATDIIARYKRMQGFNVLHPMGWDAFGLPAEQYALQTGTHPAVTTEKNVNRFREQLQSLGFSYDWDREVATTDPEYYKWTQWIFLQLLKRGLAYQAEVPVNWCEALGTVLANEEVINGKSERGDHPVVRVPMKQWMLKITAYADRLLEDLDELEWDDSIKEMQRNWIGRSEGASIKFTVEGHDEIELEVFTTRPDTLFGVTYMVVAPEHPMLERLASDGQRASVAAYVESVSSKSDLDRTSLSKEKSGVFTGSYAVNPANGELIPIWVADYVLGTYGSGCIMAVPAHDTRDFEFAEQFGLPVVRVVEGGELPFTRAGTAVNSASTATGLDIDGKSMEEALPAVLQWLEARNLGTRQVNYKLRDWLFARQRYWGEPFPVMYAEGSAEPIAVPEEELPLVLPETDNFKPGGMGQSPLANVGNWIQTTDPGTGKPAVRDTNTMPQWAGSCWYYLRFIDPRNKGYLVDPELEKYWMPVDLYVGGAEHAVLHLLYARFWHKVLYDIGVVSTKEPFRRLVSQGMILGEVEYTVFKDENGAYVTEDTPGAVSVRVAPEECLPTGNGFALVADPSVKVNARAHKMSKSRGNVINPDEIVSDYGADSLRLYEMFMGPLRETKVWNTKSVEGVHRFLARSWRLLCDGVDDVEATPEQLKATSAMVKKVTNDTEEMRFNTAISAMMEFTNFATKWENRPRSALEPFILALSPYAPHIAEELWERCGHSESLAYAPWPQYNESLLVETEVTLPVQVNGKVRGNVLVDKAAAEADAIEAAMGLENVQKFTDGKKVVKVIYRAGKILNIVVK